MTTVTGSPGLRVHRPMLAVAAAGALFMAAYAACMAWEPAQYLSYNVAYQFPAMLGVGLAIIPIRRSAGRERLGWLLLAAMLLTWCAADWVFAGYTLLAGRDAPFPGLPDVFYYAGYVAFLPSIALLTLHLRGLRRGAWIVDAAIVMCGAAAVSWEYLIDPAQAANVGILDKLVALGYPVLDLGVLALVVIALYQGGATDRHRAEVLALAAVLLVVADSAYTYSWAVAKLDTDGGLVDLPWLAAYWTFAAAMVMPAHPRLAEAAPGQVWSAFGFLLPYATALPLTALALARAATGDHSLSLTLGAIVVIGLVAARQLIVFSENRSLVWRLRRENEDRETLLRALSDLDEALLIVENRRIIFANDAAARMTGLAVPELLALPSWAELLPLEHRGDDAPEFQSLAALENGMAEAVFLGPGGRRIDVELASSHMESPSGTRFTVVAREITARRAAERELLQSRKLESLGLLAGGIAHDFNNILTAILVTASLLKQVDGHSEEDAEAVALIEDAALRGANITGRLLAFSRGGLSVFGPMDLSDLVRDTLRLAGPGLTPSVTVQAELSEERICVHGDRAQLEQALLNIVLNARDAMPGGGTLGVTIEAREKDATIRISDTGVGMDADTRARIFEPFFTTKAPGAGTGLGLSTAYGIVQGHRGELSVESEPGAGTTFVMRLPRD